MTTPAVNTPNTWQQELRLANPLATDAETFAQLQHYADETRKSVEKGQLFQAQSALEQVLAYSLLALSRLEVNADKALCRVLTQWQRQPEGQQQRRFLLYSDYVEIWLGTDYKGGWPLHTADEQQAVYALANDLHAVVEVCQSKQLSLL
jgi:hypothetical protein